MYRIIREEIYQNQFSNHAEIDITTIQEFDSQLEAEIKLAEIEAGNDIDIKFDPDLVSFKIT